MTGSRRDIGRADAFADRLRRLREGANLTQEALAERAGLTPNAVGSLERGEHRHPYPATVRALADALLLADDARAAFAALVPKRGAPPNRSAVPVPAPRGVRLHGRLHELAIITGMLQDPGVRLVTLTGPGGIGKTTLALRVAADLAPDFADGVIVVDLTPVRDPALVLPMVVRALGLREGGAEHAIAYLRERALLLVLDNLEQVIEAAADVAAVLAACSRLLILATSRVRLNIAAERVYPVPPLATASDEPAGTIAPTPAAELFADRARSVDPGFSADRQWPAIEAICRRLDGLPLAIELAAARSVVLSPEALLPRLARRLPLLTGGPRDAPARQRTLRDTLAWSYDLLEPAEQALFRRLAVFVGGFTVDAAEAVAEAPADPPIDILPALEALMDASLLTRTAQPKGAPRFGMLETIREYGLGQLDASGEADAIRQRHAAWCLTLAEMVEPPLMLVAGQVHRLDAEQGNLRAALAWFAVRGQSEASLRLASAMGIFWHLRGRSREGSDWLERALVNGAHVRPSVRAKALYCAGFLAVYLGDFSRATDRLTESLAFYRTAEDRLGIVATLSQLAGIAEYQDDDDQASRLQEEAFMVARDLGDKVAIAVVLLNLGDTAYRQGDLGRAAMLADDALPVCDEVGDRTLRAIALGNLAQVALDRGDRTQAADLYGESMRIYTDLGFRAGIADALAGLAGVAVAGGDPERAARLLGAAAAASETLGIPVLLHHKQQKRALVTTRAALSEHAFAAAWDAGRALSIEQALVEAAMVCSRPLPPMQPER